jgi:hypothetical protein
VADFNTLKENITIMQVVEMIGLEATGYLRKDREGETYRCICPMCKGPRAFQIYPSTNSYYCWGECKQGGSIIDLAIRFYDLKPAAAAKKLSEHFKLSAPRTADARDEKPFDVEGFQKSLNPDAPELAPLRISADTLRFYGGGFCTRPSLRGKLALPIADVVGTVKGFMGIAIDTGALSFPKVKDFVVPYFFGVDKLESGVLHIVHHPIDLLRAVDGNIPNVLALLTPVTPDVLTSLKALMEGKELHMIEFH